MAEAVPGPSKSKKPKLTFKNPKKLTDEELLAALLYSSDEDDESSNPSDAEADIFLEEGESDSEEDDTDDDHGGKNGCTVTCILIESNTYFGKQPFTGNVNR